MSKYPKGWDKCPSLSEGVIADKFFVFKSPITKSKYRENRFIIEDVINHLDTLKQKFVCWIDLTDTAKYYTRDEVTSKGIQYRKLAFRGAGKIPYASDVEEFLNVCRQYKNSEGIIGIHCTHGYNRTGYLICKYLISELNYSPRNSISEFATLRPPGIYRTNYIWDISPDFPAKDIPSTPSWDV